MRAQVRPDVAPVNGDTSIAGADYLANIAKPPLRGFCLRVVALLAELLFGDLGRQVVRNDRADSD